MTYNNPWLYNNTPFESEQIQSWTSFVYQITDLENGKRYIGKKNFVKDKVLKPLKGQKRKRRSVVESDWKEYYSSSEQMAKKLEELGEANFKREILVLCSSKGMVAYLEGMVQMVNRVMERDDFYNGIVNMRIGRNAIKNGSYELSKSVDFNFKLV